MSIGGELYDVGTVGIADSNAPVSIAVITLSIVGALVLGAVMALAVMFHVRKKKKGENILMQAKNVPIASSLLLPVPPANIEHRLSTRLSRAHSRAAADLSPTGDYRRGESGGFIPGCRLRKWTFH